MGYAKLSARPRHLRVATGTPWRRSKKVPRTPEGDPRRARVTVSRSKSGGRTMTRVGQKNKITRRWARRGTRPSAPKDQRTTSAYIFGAICPTKGKAAGLVMPRADTHALNAHLAEIVRIVEPGAHALVMLDQAGWHTSSMLEVPHNISLMALPPRSPELNAGREPLAVHARQLALQPPRLPKLAANPVSASDDILDHCCEAWNKIVDSQPDRITSIGNRKWAHGF